MRLFRKKRPPAVYSLVHSVHPSCGWWLAGEALATSDPELVTCPGCRSEMDESEVASDA